MTSNPHLSAATAAGTAADVDVAWDRGNDQWWDWYMSLAANPAGDGTRVPGPGPYAGPLPTDAAGEVSFHSSHCLHTAGGNRTTAPRMVLATTYFADGARVVDAPTMVSGDWRQFVPGAGPGEVVASERNPVVG